MKKNLLILYIIFLANFLFANKYDLSSTHYITIENFQFQGEWMPTGVGGSTAIIANKANQTASTVVNVGAEGEYFVWVQAADYANDKPGTRLMKVLVNGVELPENAGKHGKDLLYWELVGSAKLNKGENFLSIKSVTNFPRCAAILITKDKNFNPNIALQDGSVRRATRRQSYLSNYEILGKFPKIEAGESFKNAKSVGISNGKLKINYTQKKYPDGKIFYERSAEVLIDSQFIPMPSFKDEALVIAYSQNETANDEEYVVSWKKSLGEIKVKVANEYFNTPLSNSNFYGIGSMKLLRIVDVKKNSETDLEITYQDDVKAKLTLSKNEPIAKFKVNALADKSGYYSIIFLSFNKIDRFEVESLQMPVSYQNHRIMKEPVVVGNRMMSQPICIVEGKFVSDKNLTCGVIADPENLSPDEWSEYNNSVCGFSLMSADAKVQPVYVQPILGGRNSKKEEGDVLEASCYMLSMSGDWTEALTKINSAIYNASKLREPYEASISEASVNIAKFMADEKASGWSPIHKGRWNIEMINTVTQPAPLAELSIALLTDDEDYYKKFSLPTIEFTLSRMSAHYSMQFWSEAPTNTNSKLNLNVPSKPWSADYYAGLYALTNSANTFLKDFYYNKNGSLRGEEKLSWTVKLGMYLAGEFDESNIKEIEKEALEWAKKSFDNKNFSEIPMLIFVNDGLYPYWWYLMDLYELTGNSELLKYARLGAFYTLSCLWNWPTPAPQQTINKNNIVHGECNPMWRGTERLRLGYDENQVLQDAFIAEDSSRTKKNWRGAWFLLKEKQVDGFKASRIGLGIEQRWTFVMRNHHKNILMPSWAPEMLKVYQHTKDDIIMKFSRHSIVGRYANYPGYYVCDYTDVYMSADYPYKGPDVTSLYHHHEPVVFMHTFDYLMAQIESRTQNKIKFPFVRQQGYVWFTNRIFGLSGKVFDEAFCKPLLNLDAVDTHDNHKISTLLARGVGHIWLIVLNDSAKEITANLALNLKSRQLSGLLADSEFSLYNSAGEVVSQNLRKENLSAIRIPPLGLIAVKMPAKEALISKSHPSLPKKSHITKPQIANEWGDFHLFRIRSPFGKDSIYAFLNPLFGKDGKAKLTVKTSSGVEKVLECNSFPFEFSHYPLDMNDEIKVVLELEDKNGKFKSEEFILAK